MCPKKGFTKGKKIGNYWRTKWVLSLAVSIKLADTIVVTLFSFCSSLHIHFLLILIIIIKAHLSLLFGADSNVAAGKLFGIPLRGTHSHAFVSSFMVGIIRSMYVRSKPLLNFSSNSGFHLPILFFICCLHYVSRFFLKIYFYEGRR